MDTRTLDRTLADSALPPLPAAARPARFSFRDLVRDYIRMSGLSGVSRRDVLLHFNEYPSTKVTVALNELLGRREAYLRNGVYRLTSPIRLDKDTPI